MRSVNFVIGFVIILSLLLAGCDELPIIGGAVDVLDAGGQGGANEGNGQDDKQDDEFFGKNRSINTAPGTESEDSQETGQNTPETEHKQYCGDGVCNAGENCDECKDCACEEPAVCYKGVCKVPECVTDEDCADDNGCTPDECVFAGHPNAFCSTEVITERRHKDGCCPKGAYVDVDSDCKPVCGDGRCDYGENERSCLEDCEHFGESGGGETEESGPFAYEVLE